VAWRGDEYADIHIELTPQGNVEVPRLPQEEGGALNVLKAMRPSGRLTWLPNL